jgi:hypothetical protein
VCNDTRMAPEPTRLSLDFAPFCRTSVSLCHGGGSLASTDQVSAAEYEG